MLDERRLSLVTLLRVFWLQVGGTWALTLAETILLAALPLLLGSAIDGLIGGNWQSFQLLLACLGSLLVVGIARRVYDTRAYGTMRVEIGAATVRNKQDLSISAQDARLDMSRELVDFLENEAPLLLTALVHSAVAITVLYLFDKTLAIAASVAAFVSIGIYAAFGRRFFELNASLNTQSEKQVSVLQAPQDGSLRRHLLLLRRHSVRLSDLEAVVYGLIFGALLSMLVFNLWFATTIAEASTGEVFTIVVYSYEFIESAVALPIVLQSITRISEITSRINMET